MEQKLYEAATQLPETDLKFEAIEAKPARRPWRAALAIAACLTLLCALGFGTYAYTAEAREYSDAVAFFEAHALSAEGLTRAEIKAVYRDITTKSFTHAKTAEVIEKNLPADFGGDFGVPQGDLTPEELAKLWENMVFNGTYYEPKKDNVSYIRYRYYNESQTDSGLHDAGYVEKYENDVLLWSVSFTEFEIRGCTPVSDGVLVYGNADRGYYNANRPDPWLAKVDTCGNLCWKKQHSFVEDIENADNEYIGAVLENADGSYAVFSTGSYGNQFVCLTRYTASGEQLLRIKTDMDHYGIQNAAKFGDNYILQLKSKDPAEQAKIVIFSAAGEPVESFAYSSEDEYYYIADMLEFNGKLYLSGYTVPKLADETDSAGGRYETAAILNNLFDNGIWEISSEELTPMLREHYTAVLLVCDPTEGTPQEFYSVKGCRGGKLALAETGELLWHAADFVHSEYTPWYSSHTLTATARIIRYTFCETGLLQREETEEMTIDWLG